MLAHCIIVWSCEGCYPFCQLSISIYVSDQLSLSDSMATAQREIFASHFKWQNLALPTSSLDDVSVKHQCDPPECFHEALKEWLKRVKPPPPWETVAAAMRSPTVGEPHSAEKVEAKHIHPQHSLPQPSPMLSSMYIWCIHIAIALGKLSCCD